MKVSKICISGPLIIEPQVFGDHRGYFFESYSANHFKAIGLPTEFVQDNQSLSGKGILRGLHFQAPPFDQGKLVRVITGAALDVIVDIRKSSPTYGKSFSIELSAKNKFIFWIPPGFAHGFYTLKDQTIFSYKCTNFYNASAEYGLMWNDPSLEIEWPTKSPILSGKDEVYKPFSEFNSPFE